jgi:DNA-binding IclR family transcriptional regulator
VETSQTLDRGLRALDVLASASAPLTMTSLASALGVSRPAAYRLVATLVAHGLARRSGDGVELGIGALRLSGGVLPLLRRAAVPVLRSLADDVGATAHLTVAESDEALAVAVVEPRFSDVHVAYREGSRHPIDRGAAGEAILRGGGWVATTGQLQPGAYGVAAPVLGVPGLRASVGVVSLGALDDAAVGPRVEAAAADLARRLA